MNLLICVFSIYGCRPRILVAIKCVQPETRARRRTPPIYVAIMFRRPVRNQYTFSGPFLLHESKNTNPLSGMWHGNWDFLDSNFCCARLFRLLVVFDVGRVLFGWFWSLVENHPKLPYVWTLVDFTWSTYLYCLECTFSKNYPESINGMGQICHLRQHLVEDARVFQLNQQAQIARRRISANKHATFDIHEFVCAPSTHKVNVTASGGYF